MSDERERAIEEVRKRARDGEFNTLGALRAAYDAGVEAEREHCRAYHRPDPGKIFVDAEESAWCPYCGAEHEIVRPGKTQPTCDCQ